MIVRICFEILSRVAIEHSGESKFVLTFPCTKLPLFYSRREFKFGRILELDEYLCWNGLDCSKDLARRKKNSRVKRKAKFQDSNDYTFAFM